MNQHNVLYTLFAVYLFLMGLTWFIQFQYPAETQPALHEETTRITVDNREINHTYTYRNNENHEITIVLFPDHLHKKSFLRPLAESLYNGGFNVLQIHYPTEDIHGRLLSHSVSSRAQFAATLLDSLGIDNAHLTGQGYGGLVLTNIASDNSGIKVDSVTLLASYGVEEFQFLGNETINRSLYSLLYPAVFTFKYLTPHLGWYQNQTFNFEFVRSQRSMEQRNFRDQLLSVEVPAMVLQPIEDRYISGAVAEENHRLLPQSYFISVSGDHQSINENPERFSKHLNWFINMAERGVLPTRSMADEKRIEKSLQPFDAENIDSQSIWALMVIVLLLALISLVSEDLACIGGGLLAASGIISFWIAVLGGALGIITADIFTYLLGRWIGKPILEKVPFKWIIKPEDVKKAEQMFEMHGVGIIFASRFLPGTRFPTYLVAGILRINFIFFIGYFLIAVAIWAPLLVGITILVGQPMIEYLQVYREYAWLILIAILVLVYSIVKIIIPLTTVTGRRRLIIKLNRLKERWLGTDT